MHDELKACREQLLMAHEDMNALRYKVTKLEALVRDYQQSARSHIYCGNGHDICFLCRRADELLKG